jgi:hypothetical protein
MVQRQQLLRAVTSRKKDIAFWLQRYLGVSRTVALFPQFWRQETAQWPGE